MNKLLWMLSGAGAGAGSESPKEQGAGLDAAKETLMEQIWPIVSTVLWILTALLAVVFIIKAVTTAMAVMKAADEPQVRQEKLNGFKYLAIGLGVAIVVLTLANVIMEIVIANAVSTDDLKALLF